MRKKNLALIGSPLLTGIWMLVMLLADQQLRACGSASFIVGAVVFGSLSFGLGLYGMSEDKK